MRATTISNYWISFWLSCCSYRGIFQSKTDLHRQIMRLCAITTKQLSPSRDLEKPTEESDKSFTFICY
jgi:hypothetical protein